MRKIDALKTAINGCLRAEHSLRMEGWEERSSRILAVLINLLHADGGHLEVAGEFLLVPTPLDTPSLSQDLSSLLTEKAKRGLDFLSTAESLLTYAIPTVVQERILNVLWLLSKHDTFVPGLLEREGLLDILLSISSSEKEYGSLDYLSRIFNVLAREEKF